LNVAKKGYRGEVEVRNFLADLGFDAERSWGSDGRAFGLASDIDIKATRGDLELHVQVKRRKKIASYLEFKNANLVAVRQDRGKWVFIMSEEMFKDVLRVE
tara:strand:- start:1104 stop:1406 length:303 start_codon:yes stop_codon:yes gene_type:complete